MKDTIRPFCLAGAAAVAAALSTGCATGIGAEPASTATIEAARHELAAVPVAVPWEGRVPDGNEAVFVRRAGETRPAQIERPADGTNLLWFFADVPAGDSRDYEVVFGEAAGPRFRWEERGADSTDLLWNDTPVLRYVHPEYDPGDVENTMKPFHHVFAPDGGRLITKGPGGRYSHHRGIYFGYNRIRTGGETLDTWHARRGEHTAHREVRETRTGPVFGEHVVAIAWKDRDGETFAEETRRVRAFRGPGGVAWIDVESKLESVAGRVVLGGDLHHGGLQFRAAQYVADNPGPSRFLRPEPWDGLPPGEEHEDTENYIDLPWNAFQFRIEGADYTVGYFSHPENPDGARMSERLYGRFGEFIPYEIDEDRPLVLRYRFRIAGTHDVTREQLEAAYAAFAEYPGR